MSTPSRVPPPSRGGEPDKTSPSTQHRKVEKVEKIDEVAEADNEQRAKQFRKFIDEADEEEGTRLPSPLDLFAPEGRTAPSVAEAERLKGLSGPGYSPPPSTLLSGTAAEELEEETALPHSSKFWEKVDEPPAIAPRMPEMKETSISSTRTFKEVPVLKMPEKEEEREEKKKKKQMEELSQIESPSRIPLPQFVIPAATTAAAVAAPYLSPEVLSIYAHMVGTITAMVAPTGDSKTEFILNSPAFANSKFYGSTISIERFGTAPYQLNIVLTGSNDAVNAFNQSIPNLLTAFQNGRFSYTINRIEASYERPVIRQKDAAREKGDQGFSEGKQK